MVDDVPCITLQTSRAFFSLHLDSFYLLVWVKSRTEYSGTLGLIAKVAIVYTRLLSTPAIKTKRAVVAVGRGKIPHARQGRGRGAVLMFGMP